MEDKNFQDKKLSIQGANRGHFVTVKANTFKQISNIILNRVWCAGIFEHDCRRINTWLMSYYCALDIDDGASIEDAIKIIAHNKFAAIIAPTKNHRLPKPSSPKVVDRYRLILKFDEPIDNIKKYHATLKTYMRWFKADRACIDPSRMYQPSRCIVFVSKGKPVKSVEITYQDIINNYYKFKRHKKIKNLSIHVQEFINNGVVFGSGRNISCYVSALEMLGCGYGEQQIYNILMSAPFNRTGFLNSEISNSIKSAKSYQQRM